MARSGALCKPLSAEWQLLMLPSLVNQHESVVLYEAISLNYTQIVSSHPENAVLCRAAGLCAVLAAQRDGVGVRQSLPGEEGKPHAQESCNAPQPCPSARSPACPSVAAAGPRHCSSPAQLCWAQGPGEFCRQEPSRWLPCKPLQACPQLSPVLTICGGTDCPEVLVLDSGSGLTPALEAQ